MALTLYYIFLKESGEPHSGIGIAGKRAPLIAVIILEFSGFRLVRVGE